MIDTTNNAFAARLLYTQVGSKFSRIFEWLLMSHPAANSPGASKLLLPQFVLAYIANSRHTETANSSYLFNYWQSIKISKLSFHANIVCHEVFFCKNACYYHAYAVLYCYCSVRFCSILLLFCICGACRGISLATKSEVQKRRIALRQFLCQSLGTGELMPGQILPSVRELAERFQLSLSVVNNAIKELAQEGLLYSVPRVGTFAGQPQAHSSEFYLLLLPYHPGDEPKQARLRLGFEERITQLGATSLVMPVDVAIENRDRGQLPDLAGVFNYAYNPHSALNWHTDNLLPYVGFASWTEANDRLDLVSFDDIDGGRQATQYLISLGHRRIAYLAFHARNDHDMHLWSKEREEGWRQALNGAGLSSVGLTYNMETVLPLITMIPDQVAGAQSMVRPLLRRLDVTAVVAANDHIALGLISALRDADIAQESWPAIVSFDNTAVASDNHLTSFDLPWQDIGRAAADLLWQRKHAGAERPPEHRKVSMRLIRRMTSQVGWSVIAQAITPAAHESESAGMKRTPSGVPGNRRQDRKSVAKPV